MKRLPFLAAAIFFTLSSLAQSQAQRPPDGGNREVLISILIPSLTKAPFSATVSTDAVRQLAEGTAIRLHNRRAIARDSAGRIFQERRLLVPDDGKHESVVTQIEISDPVAHTLYICVPKEAVESFSAPAFTPPPAAANGRGQSGARNLEDLGKQTVGGVETVGTRNHDHRTGRDRQRQSN